jgi:DNA-binding winged helix-turn-helix (wHTH) protein
VRELSRDSEPVAAEPQVLNLPVYLVKNRDRVTKHDLIASVWGGRIVSDATSAGTSPRCPSCAGTS